ncbi:MAG: hypothetical protein M0Z75_12530 [Nitrospiraceae bacterium]|nr:hypothetical protein [Nitrospiraceae bacterium]
MTPMMRFKLMAFAFLLSISAFFLAVSPALAAYRLILKNGSVLEGIGSYTRADGEIRFQYGGGTIGIPEKDVLRIEKSRQEPTVVLPEYTAPAKKTQAQPSRPKTNNSGRLAEINRRLAEIKAKEDEYRQLKAQYQEVMLRIQNLFNQGRQAAIGAGKSQIQANQQYGQFLGPAQQQMVQANFLAKQQLEAKIKDMETNVLPPLMQEKARLLQEKQELESLS